MTGRGSERALSIALPLALVLAWEAAADTSIIDVRLFPAPSSVLRVLAQMCAPTATYPLGELWFHLGASLSRVAIGSVLGGVPAIVLGIMMGLVRPVRALIQPIVDSTLPVPKLALLPLLVLIFGLGEPSKWAIIAIAVWYVVLVNTLAGVVHIDPIYFDVGRDVGASRWLMFCDIALPGALPMIVTGVKLGIGIAWLVIVAAEQVAARNGIGYLIWTSWQLFQIERMYVGLLVSAVLGVASAAGLRALERALIPWGTQ